MREKIWKVLLHLVVRDDDAINAEEATDQILALTVGELKRQLDIRRDNAFSESLFGSREHQAQMQAKVDTYDTVLKIIREL